MAEGSDAHPYSHAWRTNIHVNHLARMAATDAGAMYVDVTAASLLRGDDTIKVCAPRCSLALTSLLTSSLHLLDLPNLPLKPHPPIFGLHNMIKGLGHGGSREAKGRAEAGKEDCVS